MPRHPRISALSPTSRSIFDRVLRVLAPAEEPTVGLTDADYVELMELVALEASTRAQTAKRTKRP